MRLNQFLHTDFGVKKLLPEWKKFFSKQYLREDFFAGIMVACAAVPLSLAIALASGVKPEIGLVSAIVGSVFCALFGGTRLSVSGPAAAMTVLIASVVQEYGVGGLLVVGFGCGLLQLLTGFFDLGRLIRFVPAPVIEGFIAGIGAIILIGQLPRALGLPAPDQAHVFSVISHIFDLFHEAKPAAAFLAVGTIGFTASLLRFSPKFPASLAAVLLFSLCSYLMGFHVELIGHIPNRLPTPHFPPLPSEGLLSLMGTTLAVYTLASLETLLSSSAMDKLTQGRTDPHDPDQEMIGQGLANMAVTLFGGIPVTGVITRSALNVQAGARTRRSALIHAFFLTLTIYLLSSWIAQIPIAVLAGVLLFVALRMINPSPLIELWRSSKSDAGIYAVTFLIIVFVDLLAGVQAGLMAALLIAAIRLGQTRSLVHFSRGDGPCQVGIAGPLTFMSSSKIELIRQRLIKEDLQKGLVFDLSAVTTVDTSGVGQFMELLKQLIDQKAPITLQGTPIECERMLLSLDRKGVIEKLFNTQNQLSPINRLIYGVERFRRESRPQYQSLLNKLAEAQKPHTLFITCSDSRIHPNLITSTDPGELFIVRNVGNIIPPFGADQLPSEGAALEFAVSVLEVSQIVLCGHSQCGAIKETRSGHIFEPEQASQLPSVSQWLGDIRHLIQSLPSGSTVNEASQANVMHQIANLKTYPAVLDKLKSGKLQIHAWFYDLEKSDIEEWSEAKKSFVPLGSR